MLHAPMVLAISILSLSLMACDGGEDGCVGCNAIESWYLDADEDGFGDANAEPIQSASPSGIYNALNNSDCDDTNGAINPDAQELPDGIDNNCDGVIEPIDPTGQEFPATGYTKIANDGIIIADQTQAWDDNGSEAAGTQWSCVRDNDTGLYWEVKTNDVGLRDAEWQYTWYDTNPATNGRDSGADGDNTSCSESGSTSAFLCNTENYEQAVNDAQLCGFDDWRLPTGDGEQDSLVGVQELQDLLNCQGYTLLYDAEEQNSDCVFTGSPLIDADYFPNTQSNFYWSSSVYAAINLGAWSVDFSGGLDGADFKSTKKSVRLVRASD